MIGADRLASLVVTVMGHVFDGDDEATRPVVDAVAELGDASDMYGLCRAAAVAGVMAAEDLTSADPTVEPMTALGITGAAERHAEDPPRLFAARFLTACAVDDLPTAAALFAAVDNAGPAARRAAAEALLNRAAALHRLAARARHEGTGP